MLNQIMRLFNKPDSNSPASAKDAVAEILRINPEALRAFEASYAKHALEQGPESFFETNSRQAVNDKHTIDASSFENVTSEAIDRLQQRIVDELLAQTETYVFDGKYGKAVKPAALPEGTDLVQNSDINRFPVQIRPQLSGELMKVDYGEPSYPHLLWYYERFLNGKNEKIRRDAYNRFRQGLDILDLDAVTYEIIGTNPNSMGNWLPQLVTACAGRDFFRIPATTVAKVPVTLLQLTRQDYREMTSTTLNIVNQWAHEAFCLNNEKEYFIKTGTYSSKFDFRNAYVHGAKEVKELGEYLLFIHHQALQIAGPLCTPCIYGVSTTNEWVVREFIQDNEGNPCIYKGLPLHTEYRVFVDCDTDKVIGMTPYWEPETMKHRFGHEADADSPHQIHDYIIYKAHEEILMNRYEENKDRVKSHIEDLLPDLNLKGQWSIDVMQNGDDFWLIDMAIAENSAFYDCVPKYLRNPREENWIPQLPGASMEDSLV